MECLDFPLALTLFLSSARAVAGGSGSRSLCLLVQDAQPFPEYSRSRLSTLSVAVPAGSAARYLVTSPREADSACRQKMSSFLIG